MQIQPIVSVVVPCYNEQESIPDLIERLGALMAANAGWEVLFVNDGSTDNTHVLLDEAANAYNWARVHHMTCNKGLGAGVRAGLSHTSAPYVCTIDSDGSYPPETLPQFIRLLEQGADIVTASPWHPDNVEADGAMHRLILSRGVSWCYRWVTGAQLYTFTALFRAYRREVVSHVTFESNGFPAVTELLIRALAHGYQVAEVPMPLLPRQRGQSKMSLTKAIKGHMMLLFQTRKWMSSERKRALALNTQSL